MKTLLFLRRLHLYLGLALLPWFFLYGFSSIPFAHPEATGRLLADGKPDWTLRSEQPYSAPVPDTEQLDTLGAQMMRDAKVSPAAFGTYRHPDGRVEVYRYTFRDATRLIYYPDEQRLTVEDRRFRWDYFLTGFHGRGGFEHEGFLLDLWGVMVDVVVAAMLLWVLSGLVMWWKLPGGAPVEVAGRRAWGWVALLSGVASFAAFLVLL